MTLTLTLEIASSRNDSNSNPRATIELILPLANRLRDLRINTEVIRINLTENRLRHYPQYFLAIDSIDPTNLRISL